MEIQGYEGFNYDDGKVGIDGASITYIQDGDCEEEEGDVQSITISARNNGVARFVNIKTESWSIDKVEDLTKLIEDFKERVLLKTEKDKTEQ